MKYAALALLLCSCSAWEAVKDPLAITAAGAGGALVGGPAGAGIAAGSTAAVLDIAKAEKDAEKAEDRLDALTVAAIKSAVSGEAGPLNEALLAEAAKRTAESSTVRNWAIGLVLALVLLIVLYFTKQVWSSKRNQRRFKEFTDRAVVKAVQAVKALDTK